MPYPTHLLPTTVVGSYPQPDWLVDRNTLHHHGVPRTHAHDIWRIEAALLEQAQDDATILAIRDMERAGIDIVTDGEIRRESYSNRFAMALQGIDAGITGELHSSTGRVTKVPAGNRPDPAYYRRGNPRRPNFSGPTRQGRQRSPCPGRLLYPARCRTISTRTRKNSRWTTLSRLTRNCAR